MIIAVNQQGHPSLRDEQNFTRFHVVREEAAWENAFPGVTIEFDETGHAWIPIALLRTYGEAHQPSSWMEQLDAMIAYAARKNWLNADATCLRAHVEDN